MTTTAKTISYLRVSTRKQGASGLGLEAQRAAVAQYVVTNGCEHVAEYLEIESARRDELDNRPQLRNALAHAKRSGATLVIAKLDRLARSVKVVSALMAAGVDFVCCDQPVANRFTIHIFAAVAENESRQISERTKAAMAAAKARGRVFGCPTNLTSAARLKGAQRAAVARSSAARDAYRDLVPIVQSMRGDGASLSSIAEHLNAAGHTTRRQRPWTKVQVCRLLAHGAAA
jgi:DNA invertase Pin-like site-specific DNA recombinase